MALYAYKHACYDIDYEKYKELVARFEKEEGREHDGGSNYDGDNWYVVAMWIEELREENAALRAELAAAKEYHEAYREEMLEQLGELAALKAGDVVMVPRDVVHQINKWAEAYPLDVFPEPDFDAVRNAFTANGLSLDCVSASNMRHVITKVRDMLAAAPGVQAGEKDNAEVTGA